MTSGRRERRVEILPVATSVAHRAVDVNVALASGQEAQDRLAVFTFDLVRFTETTGLREHARLATRVAALTTDLHLVLEELAADADGWGVAA